MIIVAVTMPEIDVLINPPTVDGLWQMVGRMHPPSPWRLSGAPRTVWQAMAPPRPQEYR